MVACPTCSTENPSGASFCMGCGAPAVAQGPAREERRTVTVLFADLAGFTSRSESLDPEDVRAFLLPYYDVLTSEVARHGGHVDRFLGDGVMALFGAPIAHEDDPERAVRAALRILERIPVLGLDLHARIGINTGPVLFAAATGQREDSVTGDSVNTAARLQALAPVDGVVVGESTHAATRSVFDYAALEPVLVKGKVKPIAAYRAMAPRARLGVDFTRSHGPRYVGRETDLALLRSLFDKTIAASTVQLVTVVGEPGIGKSRIVGELFAYAQLQTPALTWRQGRCLPYGDGITYWALGEIVKAQAGILETDDPATATAKIVDALPAGPDRDWLGLRLLPLVGVDVARPAGRDELFAAWRTFIETVAEQRPTVLVFEDIHWADDAMLAFLEHLADRAQGVPLFLVATARPELFERHPTFAAGLPNMNRVNLAPLADTEIAELVCGLLGARVSPALLAPIQERAEGNPLYAEEFVRLLRDRGHLVQADGMVSLGPEAVLPLPESIGALIAARLDTLPPERKAMLSDAAVVGKVFWAGAVAAMGGRDVHEVTEAMHELARKELVRPSRRSSMAGEAEYAFWHVLTRDVGYAELPRASRSARHVAAAAWMEGKAGERLEDIAEVLAHHYATAVELARAAGQSEQAAELEEPALRYLTMAGEKAMSLDTATAVATLERALNLAPVGHPGRARLLRLLGAAERANANIAAALAHMQEAIVICTASGDQHAADEINLDLQKLLHASGDRRAGSGLDAIIERLELEGPSELLADAYSTKQFYDANQPWADRALAIAERLDLPAVRQDALNMRGLSRANRGDPGGIDDLRTSLDLALGQHRTRPAHAAYINLAWSLVPHDLMVALEVADAGAAFDRSRGTQSSHVIAVRQWALLGLGRWDELLEVGDALVAKATSLGDRWTVRYAAAPMAIVLSRRGMAQAAVDICRASSDDAYETKGLFALALVAPRMLHETAEAERMLADAVVTWEHGDDGFYGCEVAREAVTLRHLDVLERLVALPERGMVSAAHARTTWCAIDVECGGRPGDALDLYRVAAAGWHSFGDPYELAHALLGTGRCLVKLGRSGDAIPPLCEARAILERLGAAPALAETNELIATVA